MVQNKKIIKPIDITIIEKANLLFSEKFDSNYLKKYGKSKTIK